MSNLFIYRVTIESYPTEDGKPFDQTDPQIFVDGVYAYANPGGELTTPDWFPADLESWMPSDHTGYGPTVDKTGHWIADAEIFVPVFNRRHWLSRNAANRSAERFREWGCQVTVQKSAPIEFEKTND
ncbi:hypothetical protein [Glutamicibacter ardleyensis]|uniref:hypothetical protein n=1 Tax=Glutamicibacter ardleyensis TaxID=225894 RepID=UPI003FD4E497